MKQYIPEEYQKVQVKPKTIRRPLIRRKTVKPGTTKITVTKPKPIVNYINIGLGITFVFLLVKTFVPQLIPFASSDERSLVTFGNLQGTQVVFDWATLTDPVKIQAAMESVPGAFVVTEPNGEVIASKNGDKPMAVASIAKMFTTVAMLEKNPQKYLKGSEFESLKYAFAISDNLYFDRKAKEVGGVEHLQTRMRAITNDERTTIANGSGCPRLTIATGVMDCGGKFPGATKPTAMSAVGVVKVIQHLETILNKNEMTFKDLAPEKGYDKRYRGRFVRKVYGKTGTINGVNSLAGMEFGPDGEKVIFVAITTGDVDKYTRFGMQAKVLNKVFPK